MRPPQDLPNYRLPDLSAISRQYVVRDDRGRYGIAHTTAGNTTLWAHPIEVCSTVTAPGTMGFSENAVLMTDTNWNIEQDGAYRGWWYDDNVPSYPAIVTAEYIRHLSIVDDLGYRLPDHWADVALSGSDEMGHWNYGATLGKVGGEPPVKGQKPGEMTVAQAADYAHEVGEQVTARGIRLAAKNGYIPNARKIGRDWLITYDGFNQYLDHRPKRGPKSSQQQ